MFSQTKRDTLVNNFTSEYKNIYKNTIVDSTLNSNKIAIENTASMIVNPNYNDNKKAYGNVNTAGKGLMDILFKMESLTYYNEKISPDSRRLISFVTEPYLMVLLQRAIIGNVSNTNQNDTSYLFVDKILKETDKQLNIMMSHKYPYYAYETKAKKAIKFISFRTGNDLFAPTQDNEDRDYTGSVLLEIGTDYLNILRRRPIKSYQTLLYGFDVFTPSFNDTTKFKNFNDYDTLDRPHASFQYFGWSKKALSKYNKLRWATTIKFGKIGGRTGEIFQTGLHQDVSYSLRPKGWDAQIANGGRVGISLENKYEYQWYLIDRDNPNSFFNFNLSPFIETKLGTYMTNGTFGFQMSNKKFSQNNHNFVNHRTKQGVVNFADHIMYNFAFSATYVVHNTMLEGYGITYTTEEKSDPRTPLSVYKLKSNQVQRVIYTSNFCVSYTTRFATLFYNLFISSPETKLGRLDANNPNSKHIDLSKRWQHFAEIGLSFNIH